MRSLVQLFSNGGAVANFWHRVPFLVKAPFVVGIVLLASAELVRDLNISLRSGRVAEGQAVDADAKIADPNQTRAAVLAGKSVTGAERQIAAQVAGLDADADQKRATADAANESEDELLAKAKRGAKLTSTEKLRLRELQLKEKELAIREQELRIKTAEASSADSKAAVNNMINGMILGDNSEAECATISAISGCVDRNGLDRFGRLAERARAMNGGNLASRMMDATAPQGLRRPNDKISKFTEGEYEKSWQRTFGVPLHPQRKHRDPGETVRSMEGRISDPFQ
jgi:hypothetical protein